VRIRVNITENIAFAEREGIPAFVLALDMAKAFDTVRHDYMRHVYKFFNLGENLIKMLTVIATGRSACIIKDSGETTAPFQLGTGFPQGNPPSPSQFNMGEQILIFKIELDPRIRPLKMGSHVIPRNLDFIPVRDEVQNFPLNAAAVVPVPAARNYGSSETERNTEKVEAFADDNNVMGLLEETALLAITDILSNFGNLSGLKCNVDKSQILLIGTDNVPEFVTRSGFAVSHELKVLGFKITKRFDDILNNIPTCIAKIRSQISYWSRFRLSLRGRLNVAKSLLLSQIGFHATIIPVPEATVTEMQQLINDFVTGTLKLDKNRICLAPKEGGLGMINIANYINGLHCSWIKRAQQQRIDNWRTDLHAITGGKPIDVNPNNLDKNFHPVLHTLAVSYWTFNKKF
jgi:hypothetical protein